MSLETSPTLVDSQCLRTVSKVVADLLVLAWCSFFWGGVLSIVLRRGFTYVTNYILWGSARGKIVVVKKTHPILSGSFRYKSLPLLLPSCSLTPLLVLVLVVGCERIG